MRRLALVTAVVLAGAAATLLVAAAMLELPAAAIDLRPAVAGSLARSGVAHPVTAVLLNYRGYDTLLEIAVLLLALFGLLATGESGEYAPSGPADLVPRTIARVAAPVFVLVGVYLLWAGATRPGGAFQAGAVLGSVLVLLHLTGEVRGWGPPGAPLRCAIAAGFALFVAIAAALMSEGALLRYPPARAGLLILAIEAGLTVSLALTLAGFFLFFAPVGGAPRR